MKTQRVIKLGFWTLALATAWIAFNECRQGRLIATFTALDESLRSNQKAIEALNTKQVIYLNSVVAVYQSSKSQKMLDEYKSIQILERRYQFFLEQIRAELLNSIDYSTKKPLQLQAANTESVKSVLLEDQSNIVTKIATATARLRAAMLSLAGRDSVMLSYYLIDFKATADGRYNFRGITGNFRELPLSGVLAILSDLQVAASGSMTTLLNYCFNEVAGIPGCNFTVFSPFAFANSYVEAGETYKADLILGNFPTNAKVLKIAVDGGYLPVKEGIAHYEAASPGVGRKSFTAKIFLSRIRNNSEGIYRDSFWVSREFAYEVIQKHAALDRPDSLQYLYAGIENPVSISSWGYVCENCLQSVIGATIKDVGGGHYTIFPRSLQPVSFVFGTAKFRFAVRPLPDPLAALADRASGNIAHEVVAKQTELTVRFPEAFDFQAVCPIIDFQLTRFRTREDREEVDNQGANFNKQIRHLLETAQSGDRLLFEAIRVQCPGDRAPRTIPALSLRVE